MKRKKLITMLTALVLVGVVGVGATFAYLSSAAELTNVFTVGNVTITLDEADYLDGEKNGVERVAEGQDTDDYGFMYPGREIVKDPTIHVTADSEDCYLFVKITGLDDLLENGFATDNYDVTAAMLSAGWVRKETTSGFDGLYQYNEKVLKTATNKDYKLFDTIKYNEDEEGKDFELTLDIKACAIQADGMADIDEASTKLDSEFLN